MIWLRHGGWAHRPIIHPLYTQPRQLMELVKGEAAS